MSFAFLVAGFAATLNVGRLALVARAERRALAPALVAPAAVVVAMVLLAEPLLDALAISPPSFRLAAALVLIAAGLRTFFAPAAFDGPFAAVLVTPELVSLAWTFGADEPAAKVLVAACVGLLPAALARRLPAGAATARFLAALQLVVAVALGVSGIRDV